MSVQIAHCDACGDDYDAAAGHDCDYDGGSSGRDTPR